MFGKKRVALIESLPDVTDVQTLLAELTTRREELDTLCHGLSSAEQEIAQLESAKLEHKENEYRYAARALVKPELQTEAERCHEQAQACAARQAELQRQIPALNGEIQQTEQRVARLRNDLDRAKQAAWRAILAQLLQEFGEEQRAHLLKIWVAGDAVWNGMSNLGVMEQLGMTRLETDTKLAVREELCEAYGLPSGY